MVYDGAFIAENEEKTTFFPSSISARTINVTLVSYKARHSTLNEDTLLQMTGPSEEQLIFIQLNKSQRH